MLKIFRHFYFSIVGISTYFSKKALLEVDAAVSLSEKQHSCQLSVAIEGSMPLIDLCKGKTCRERAWEIFSLERIWDTKNNVGILLFISLAEKDIEIVVDRSIADKISDQELEEYCKKLQSHYQDKKNFSIALINLIEEINSKLKELFPKITQNPDEIANRIFLV